MEQKAFLFTSMPIIALIIVFGYMNIQQEKSLNPEITEITGQCQSIIYNGEDRIDLLFISSKEEAQHYTKVIFDAEPYKTYNNYFNIYVLEEEPECDYYKDIAILCNTKKTLSLAKNCPNDYIITVKEDSPKIRSSAYGSVMSINSAHEDSVLIHELGHALGNLAEEYVPANIPRGSENCVSSCDKFTKSSIDSCDLECSQSNYYRSIKSGVMRTLATSNYGTYNIALLSELLEKNKPKETTITGNQISEEISCDNNIIELQLVQSESPTIKTDNILQTGCAPDKGLSGSLCVEELCNINTLFTDTQNIYEEETLEGETHLNPEAPLIFYIKQNKLNPEVEIILDNQIISKINTAEAGATACKI